MNKIQRVFAILLCVLLCMSMLACGGRKDAAPSSESAPSTTAAPSGEALAPLPDENGDGNPDVPEKCAAVLYLSINPEFCVYYNGQGRYLCNTCHGDYAVPCEACNETGVTPCGMCPTEKGVCEMCHGSGILDT